MNTFVGDGLEDRLADPLEATCQAKRGAAADDERPRSTFPFDLVVIASSNSTRGHDSVVGEPSNESQVAAVSSVHTALHHLGRCESRDREDGALEELRRGVSMRGVTASPSASYSRERIP